MANKIVAKVSGVVAHKRKIEQALARAAESFFEVVMAIKAARDALGEDSFQKDLADQLSISRSTVSKYLQIADCAPLLKRQKSLPPRLTTLYNLAQTHKAFIEFRGPKKGELGFKKLMERFGTFTEANDVIPHLKEAKARAKQLSKKNRENNILGFSDKSFPSGPTAGALVPWLEIETDSVFRTIFINPPEDVLRWASGLDVFENHIAERYHIAELRSPSQSETVEGFVYCAAKHIDAGLKILTASGFQYRDMFSPSSGATGYEPLKSEKVLLRGERGAAVRFITQEVIEASDQGALRIAENLGGAPRLYVFAVKPVDGWTCSFPGQR